MNSIDGTPVPSPCINVCLMDSASGWCQGCQRTLDEIALWSRLGEDDKRAIWAELAQRRLQRGTAAAGVPAAASAA